MSKKPGKTVFPIHLLLEGKECLVVGAGTVATRKVKSLLEAHARVMVVGPQQTGVLEVLGKDGDIRLENREFHKNDLKGMFLCFAATDNTELNGEIVSICAAKGVLCCAVDEHWKAGDFITPASYRNDSVTVSVSTGGQSCTESRKVRNKIGELIEETSNQGDD